MGRLTPWILIALAVFFRGELLALVAVIKAAWQVASWIT